MSFPERVRLRDTGLHDDLGGAGQRIFTTAGQGYEKVEYVRADLVETGNDESLKQKYWAEFVERLEGDINFLGSIAKYREIYMRGK